MDGVFFPQSTYWRADDGRVYSGPAGQPVSDSDAGYQAYIAAGHPVRAWPRDANGAQTTGALQDVLTPYGMFADLLAYSSSVRFSKETGGFSVNGVTYPTDRETQSKLGNAFLLASRSPTETFKWKLGDGSFSPTLTASEMMDVAATIGAFVNGLFSVEDTVSLAISAGTTTTKEQVDAAYA